MSPWPDLPDGTSVRVGCDIVTLAEVEHSVAEFGDRYLRKVFAEEEIRDCVGADRIGRLASRFAAKEAVIKVFGAPDAAFPLPEIVVTRSGAIPALHLTGSVARLAREHGWIESSLSLSHADCHAMAVVAVACRPPSRPGVTPSGT